MAAVLEQYKVQILTSGGSSHATPSLDIAPVSGNALVTLEAARWGASGPVNTLTPPSGFTAALPAGESIARIPNMEAHTAAVALKEATGSEGNAYTVNWTTGANISAGINAMYEYSGVPSPVIDKVEAAGSGSTNVTSIATTSTGTLSASEGLAFLVGLNRLIQTPNTFSNNAGMTETYDNGVIANNVAFNMVNAWQAFSTNAAYNVTVSTGSASRMGAMIVTIISGGSGPVSGDATASWGFSASSTGAQPNIANATASWGFSASSTASSIHTRSVTSSWGFTGTSIGYNPDNNLGTDFSGTLLSNGWTFGQNGTGTASLDVSGGFATLQNPAGVTFDSISSVGGSENSAGLIHDVSGDFDVAVRVASTVQGDGSTLFGFILQGATDAEMVRWSVFGTIDSTQKYGFARFGGAGNNFQGVANLNYLRGHPAWIRVKRVGTTYTFYTSFDGATWTTESSVTSNVDAETIKLKLGQYNLNLGLPFRYDKVVDLGSLGITDARAPAPVQEIISTETTDFTTLPSWLSLSQDVDGTATLSGGTVVLTTAPANGSYGRLVYNGTGHPNAGLLVKLTPSGSTSAFTAFGLAVLDGGPNIDNYSLSPLYGIEGTVGNGLNSPLRVTRPITTNFWEEAYTIYTGFGAGTTISGTYWCRMERFNERFSIKLWADGGSEPSVWTYEIEDDTLEGEGNLAPFFGISHNDGDAVSGSLIVDDLLFYLLEAPYVPNGDASHSFGFTSTTTYSTEHSVEASHSFGFTTNVTNSTERSSQASHSFGFIQTSTLKAEKFGDSSLTFGFSTDISYSVSISGDALISWGFNSLATSSVVKESDISISFGFDYNVTANKVAFRLIIFSWGFISSSSIDTTRSSDIYSSWGASASSTGNAEIVNPIIDYVVEYRTTIGPGSWILFDDGIDPNTGATVTSLSPGVSYDFRVAAINDFGQGLWSNIATAVSGAGLTASGDASHSWGFSSNSTKETVRSGDVTASWGFGASSTEDSIRQDEVSHTWGFSSSTTLGSTHADDATLAWGFSTTSTVSTVKESDISQSWGFSTTSTVSTVKESDISQSWGFSSSSIYAGVKYGDSINSFGFSSDSSKDSVRNSDVTKTWGWSASSTMVGTAEGNVAQSWGFQSTSSFNAIHNSTVTVTWTEIDTTTVESIHNSDISTSWGFLTQSTPGSAFGGDALASWGFQSTASESTSRTDISFASWGFSSTTTITVDYAADISIAWGSDSDTTYSTIKTGSAELQWSNITSTTSSSDRNGDGFIQFGFIVWSYAGDTDLLSMIFLGPTMVSKIYYGSVQVQAAYLGINKVF